MRRQNDAGIRTLAAELIDDLGGLAPVRIDQRLFDFQHRAVLAFPFPPKAITGQGIQCRVQSALEARIRIESLNRRIGVGQAESPPMLIGIRAVIDHRAGEILRPCDYDIKKQSLLYIDEHCELVAGQRNSLLAQPVDFGADFINRQHGIILGVFRQGIVLILAGESCLILKFQVHRVLKRTLLVVVEPRFP
ncbi:hypothetical protein SDC9_65412 [bioreactor metagenome]|uniref:Uncharacterized protein n=1 Tax=bioreactor metagenome TaxID=1076179 RepID=A0A644XY81_9ZZZZ